MKKINFEKCATAILLAIFLAGINKIYAAQIEPVDMYRFGNYTESWEIQPCWSPIEEGTIVYTVRDAYWGRWEIGLMVMPADIKDRLTRKLYQAMDPAWSPDGEKVIFSGKESEKAKWEIMSIDLKKGNKIVSLSSKIIIEEETAVDLQGDYAPSYSPDGKSIVFVHCNKDGNKDIYIMANDGTNRRKLTGKPSLIMDTPRWSPDGKMILFMQDENIWVMNADGSNPVPLTTDFKFNENPAWSQDGKMIAYSSCAGGSVDIWVMSVDGKDKTQLTLSQEAEDYPSWSQDGRKMAFQIGHIKGRIWVVELEQGQVLKREEQK